jgi:hypothetical protein
LGALFQAETRERNQPPPLAIGIDSEAKKAMRDAKFAASVFERGAFDTGSANDLHDPVPDLPQHDAFEQAAHEAELNPNAADEREIAESPFKAEVSAVENDRLRVLVGQSRAGKGSPIRVGLLAKRGEIAAQYEIKIRIKSRSQVVQYSKLLIAALEEIVDYEPARHHNQPPPDLRIGDEEYLREIRNLIAELRTLNSLLETTRRQPKKATGAVVKLTRHFDTFLSCYAKSLARGAGWLTIGVIASLLYQAGIGREIIDHILSHAKLPH